MSIEIPKVRVGLVGVSGFAQNHLMSLLAEEAAGRLMLTCATIINQSEVADVCQNLRDRGVRIYDDFHRMLAGEKEQLDLCLIPTGISLHCPMTVAALDAGCHVLVEKPLAGTCAEVDAMIAARDSAKRQVFVGFQNLYQDSMEQVKARILAGEFGRIEAIRAMGCWPRPVEYYQRNNWAGRLKVGESWVYDSPANNALSHVLMDALFLCGPTQHMAAKVVKFEANLFRVQPIESFDTISARLETDTGVSILYSVTHSSSVAVEPVIEIRGSRGSIHWEMRKHITLHPSGEVIPLPDSSVARSTMYKKVLDAISRPEVAEIGGLETARSHTAFINLLHANCPIEPIPDDWVATSRTEANLTQRAVPGLERTIQESYELNRTFDMRDIARGCEASSA